jgi:predicted nucleic acid-binding protein
VIVYFDASALVKRYLREAGTEDVVRLSGTLISAGTSLISRAEVSAAIGRAARLGAISRSDAEAAVTDFRRHWLSLFRVRVDETTMARADTLAWELGLRGYDAVHLASALTWREAMAESPVFATFDRALAKAARAQGLDVWPESLE